MKPYYQYNHSRIFNKDCRSMDELPDESVDLIATDPPYGISFMGKDWDRALPDRRIWAECLRVLKPGAFAFVMSIPRADCLSRMIISLEDAGFRVDFTPIFWTYASGFPKAQNISRAVDKRLGIKREMVRQTPSGGFKRINAVNAEQGFRPENYYLDGNKFTSNNPISPEAQALDGSYAGFQTKPAVEVILVAMKPLSEKTYVDQALKNQKGITWLDSCRIPYEGEADKEGARFGTQMDIRGGNLKTPQGVKARDVLSSQSGRFPANLLASDDVLNDGKPHHSGKLEKNYDSESTQYIYGKWSHRSGLSIGDSGSFSRFFDLDKWWLERIKQLPESAQRTFPFLIVPKASKREKNEGLGEAIARSKHGSSRRDWEAENKSPNPHPTVKPIKLMSYLITLGSREGDTVVDPFIGSGSMAIACQILGRRCTGYEINPDYCEIAKSRLSWCRQQVLL